ncbi:MAG: DUF1616 domain-containing protein [Actinomycetota bacterium]|nr:DUF1616 domain-containing protein [Actinomycetota bacterium]
MRRSTVVWSAVSFAAIVAALAVTFASVDGVARAAVAVPFVLVFPGTALVRLAPVGDLVATATLSVALSIALAIVVPALLVYAGAWSPHAALAILAGVTAGATCAEVVVARLRLSGDREAS